MNSIVDAAILSLNSSKNYLKIPSQNICKYFSRYVSEARIKDFFEFQDCCAVNFLHINCRSLKKNFDSVKILLSNISSTLTAVAVSETWLKATSTDAYIISGYKFVSSPRNPCLHKRAGGVGIYVNNSLRFKIRVDICQSLPHIECIFIEIDQLSKKNILIGCIYRPPESDVNMFNAELLRLLNIIDSENTKIILLAGDYNLDLLKYNAQASIGDFLNYMMSYNLFPTIRHPTRVTETSSTLLDNIFVNSLTYDLKPIVLYNDISDHFPVAIHLKTHLEKIKNTFIQKRFYDAVSIANFKIFLNNVDWSNLYEFTSCTCDASDAYDIFFDIYGSGFEKYFPIRTFKLSNHMTPRHAWITKGLMRSCVKKSKLYKKYKKSGTSLDKNIYIAYRNRLKLLLRIAEKNYYSDKIKQAQGNMHDTWKIIDSVLGKKKSEKTPNSFTIDGKIITDSCDIVDKFNEYFTTIGSSLAATIPTSIVSFKDYLKHPGRDSFFLYPTDSFEIINIVNKLKVKTCYGMDGIPINIIKATIENIAEPLSILINCSLSTGIVPDKIKIGKICPVYKNGEKDSFSNYRPISVLSNFSKIYEKIISNRLQSYIDSKKILSNVQYGFQSNHSTYMAILDMYSKISSAIDKDEFSIGIFVDLSKAFDTLNHDILLQKLEYYGIRGIPLKWFKSYLSNRQQCVSINGVSSTLKHITCGVPQGSILGPLLFVIYINDIVECSPSLTKILFADDTNLFHSDKDVLKLFRTVNHELFTLSEWFKANKLSLNAKKTHYILFTNKKVDMAEMNLELKIDDIILECVDQTKFLGVYIDKKLNWIAHIDYISPKISRGLGITSRVRNVLPCEVLLMLYYTLIYPYLSYCCIIWGHASKKVLNRLIILQKRSIRIITGSTYLSSTGPLFKQLNLLTLFDICTFQTVQFMYKFTKGLLPRACSDFCLWSNDVTYITRHHSIFKIPAYRTNVFLKSISVSGPKLWDILPPHLQATSNLITFKKEVTLHLIARYN